MFNLSIEDSKIFLFKSSQFNY